MVSVDNAAVLQTIGTLSALVALVLVLLLKVFVSSRILHHAVMIENNKM